MISLKHPRHRPLQPWVPVSGARVNARTGLQYREFEPPAALSGILVHVWTLTGQSPQDEPIDYHVVPDGCSDLIFDQEAGEGFVFGTVTSSKTVRISGSARIVGVRLQPHLLPGFTGIPASAVCDVEQSFREASIGDFNALFERHAVSAKGSTDECEATKLAHAIAARLRPERVNIRAHWLTSALLAGGGSVDEAARTTGFSARQLQRIARHEIGFSPKLLGRILRLQQSLPAVLRGEGNHTQVAADHGFSDQAHMIREFNTLTGYSPGFWREREKSELFNPEASAGR